MMKTALSIKTLSRISAYAAAGMLAIAFAPVQATGATQLTKNGTNLYDQRTIQFGSVTATGQTSMGAWQVNETGGDQGFWVYCIDPLNKLENPDYYDKTSLDNFLVGANGYAKVFSTPTYQASGIKDKYDDSNTNPADVAKSLKELYAHAYLDSLKSKEKSAAFQFAIWEIEGEKAGSYSRTAGGFQYTGTDSGDQTFTTTVDKYLAGLNTGTWATGLTTATNYTFTVFNPNPAGGQALLRVTAGGKVPEPGSLALAGLALFGVVYTRRQGKSKAH